MSPSGQSLLGDLGYTVQRLASTRLLQVNGVTCHFPINIADCTVASSDIMLFAIIVGVAAPPCFCLNGGSYDGSQCVCDGDYFGVFCGNLSGKNCSKEQKLLYICISCDIHKINGLVPVRCWASVMQEYVFA